MKLFVHEFSTWTYCIFCSKRKLHWKYLFEKGKTKTFLSRHVLSLAPYHQKHPRCAVLLTKSISLKNSANKRHFLSRKRCKFLRAFSVKRCKNQFGQGDPPPIWPIPKRKGVHFWNSSPSEQLSACNLVFRTQKKSVFFLKKYLENESYTGWVKFGWGDQLTYLKLHLGHWINHWLTIWFLECEKISLKEMFWKIKIAFRNIWKSESEKGLRQVWLRWPINLRKIALGALDQPLACNLIFRMWKN